MIEQAHHCKDLFQTMSDYVDGQLSENLCHELERHLQECPDCRIVVNTLRKTIDLYHTSNSDIDLPEGARDRLFSRLNMDEFCK